MRKLFSCILIAIAADAALAQTTFLRNRNTPFPPVTAGYDMCLGDVDGDGDLDAVIANDHAQNQLFLNDGRGGFVDATAGRLSTPFLTAADEVDLVDIDGDGDLDLLVSNDDFQSNRVHLNNGAGVFTDVTNTALPPNGEYTMDQVIGDFDGDGDVDWLACDNPDSVLYLNNGQGVFALAPVQPPRGVTGDNRSFAADLDQDGDLDLVLGRGGFYLGSSLPQVLLNQGNAVFVLSATTLIPESGLVHAADVDGDGRIDLLSGGGTRYRRNLGGLAYAAPIVLPAASIAAGDFDRDGDIDLLGTSTLMIDNGGTFTAQPLGVTLDDRSTCVGDLDDDGDLDAVNCFLPASRCATNMLSQIHTPNELVRGALYMIEFHGGSAAAPVFYGHAVAGGSAALPLPPFGTLRLDPASLILLDVMVSRGTPPGRLPFVVPTSPTLVGVELHHQGIVLAPNRPLFLSNAVRDVVR